MGVSGLLLLLKSVQKPCHLKDLAGKTVGVDAYGWLHRGARACAGDLAQGKPTTKFVEFCMHRVRMLVHFGVKPYLVFDGDRLPSKADTEKSRAVRRQESLKTALQLQTLGRISQAEQEFQKAVDISPQLARQLIDELKRNNVEYVVAPYEADAQLAYLEAKGYVDAVVSEDSDLLVFGVRNLLTKLDQYGSGVMISQDDFTKCREVSLAGWTISEFRKMCILSGCDYLDSIPKMGLKNAHRLVRKYKTIENVIRGIGLEAKMRVPAGYLERFQQAEKTFLYHWVFNPETQTLVHLTELPSSEELSSLEFLGSAVSAEVAGRISRGEIDPMTKKTLFSVPSRNTQRRPLLPSTPAGKLAKPKTLENFFKRRPLAELDPNSMAYSPSQERVYVENQNREWSSTPASAPPVLSRSQTMPAATTPSQRTPLSESQRSKRTRLCDDDNDTGDIGEPAAVRSKFFGRPQPSPLQQLKTNDSTPVRKAGVRSYLDSPRDSVLDTPQSSVTRPASKKRKQIEIFSDDVEDIASDEPVPEASTVEICAAPSKSALDDHDVARPFTSNLADVERIKRFTFQYRYSFDEALANTVRRKTDQTTTNTAPSQTSGTDADCPPLTQGTSQMTSVDIATPRSVDEHDDPFLDSGVVKDKTSDPSTTDVKAAAKLPMPMTGGSEDQIISDSEGEDDTVKVSFGTRLNAFRYGSG